MNYKKLYFELFNCITDTIENLKQVQIKVEEEFLNMPDEEETKVVALKAVKPKQATKNKSRTDV